jgi:hypothetical protein
MGNEDRTQIIIIMNGSRKIKWINRQGKENREERDEVDGE